MVVPLTFDWSDPVSFAAGHVYRPSHPKISIGRGVSFGGVWGRNHQPRVLLLYAPFRLGRRLLVQNQTEALGGLVDGPLHLFSRLLVEEDVPEVGPVRTDYFSLSEVVFVWVLDNLDSDAYLDIGRVVAQIQGRDLFHQGLEVFQDSCMGSGHG